MNITPLVRLDWKKVYLGVLCFWVSACSAAKPPSDATLTSSQRVEPSEETPFQTAQIAVAETLAQWYHAQHRTAQWELDTLIVRDAEKEIEVRMTDSFGYVPYREGAVTKLYEGFKAAFEPLYPKYRISITALGVPIEQLIPNLYRIKFPADKSRLTHTQKDREPPLVTPLDRPFQPNKGLLNRNIALWHSHGWYYEQKLNRWEWQRARTFQTVEDLLPLQFVLPYLVPMLEKAGANVFLPRERDWNRNEVVVDAESPNTPIETGAWEEGGQGFAWGAPPYPEGVNPFKQGKFRQTIQQKTETATTIWQPNLPEAGPYAVYISYASLPESSTEALYTVHHTGGASQFLVNQRMGGGTWIYLGTFPFAAGTEGKVVLTNALPKGTKSPVNAILTADAVRFGGGMGLTLRNGTTSNRPKFVEGARYWMQYAGMPDSLVYNVSVSQEDDYKDDYQGRGEWVNYLKGAPFGPNKNPHAKGLGIPIDLSLAFHTDAGQTLNGRVVGTLMIYSSKGFGNQTQFADGQSRFASRDFADILQTELVDDLRMLYDSLWTRREIWDKDYSEAFRPNVPAALLELLSHQNFTDQRFAADPRFRFDVSRAIYKAMLRFLAYQVGEEPVIQPLAPTHFRAELKDKGVLLGWRPQNDPLEVTATPSHYMVYTRKGQGGFDNGVLVEGTELFLQQLDPDVLYSFKVTAVNAGGESFPSEVLSVGRASTNKPTLLVVNAFDRISAPKAFKEGNVSGFAHWEDQGVPDHFDLGYTGAQFNFKEDHAWEDDDAPGHGASYGDYEGRPIAGNTFDFPAVHGASLLRLGYSFASCSDEALMEGEINLAQHPALDLILGEERETDWPKNGASAQAKTKAFKAFPEALQQVLRRYLSSGGKLFASGSYIGTDLNQDKDDKDPDRRFAKTVLRMQWRTHHAAKKGEVLGVDPDFMQGQKFSFNTELRSDLYAAEAPDGIEPAFAEGKTLLRYTENNISAAYGQRNRLVLLGFPFEVILDPYARDQVLQASLKWLGL